jgi:predicted metal-dependent phosphoesterase TrpH
VATTWSAFAAAGQWYKGNLHCHSTESDGAISPEHVVSFYQERGYAFLALSDHRRVTDLSRYVGARFLPLGAMEIDGSDSLTGGPYHMLAIGLRQFRAQQPGVGLVEMLAATAADGGVTVFCHPYWLGTCATDLLGLEGCLGVEVFNANCEVEIGKGYSMQCWDDLLQRGKRFFGFATDDAHWRQADHGLGWIMVKAAQLDEAYILAALRDGQFYSSSGPEIHALTLEDGVARVRCSPVDAIHFVGDTRHGERVAGAEGRPITEASYTLRGRERYLRVECVRNDGTRAWSNPLWLT